jgi:hypothetical protein
MYHENLSLLCDALHKVIPSFPVYLSSFILNLVCSPDLEKCMMSNCDTCTHDKAETWLSSFTEEDINNEVLWCEW